MFIYYFLLNEEVRKFVKDSKKKKKFSKKDTTAVLANFHDLLNTNQQKVFTQEIENDDEIEVRILSNKFFRTKFQVSSTFFQIVKTSRENQNESPTDSTSQSKSVQFENIAPKQTVVVQQENKTSRLLITKDNKKNFQNVSAIGSDLTTNNKDLRSSLKKKIYKVETQQQKNNTNQLEMLELDSNLESNILTQTNYAKTRISNESATEKVTTI